MVLIEFRPWTSPSYVNDTTGYAVHCRRMRSCKLKPRQIDLTSKQHHLVANCCCDIALKSYQVPDMPQPAQHALLYVDFR